MNSKTLLFVAIFLIAGCTHVITRTGYKYDNSKNVNGCKIKITKGININSKRSNVIGRVKVGDSGFAVACGEDDALEIFKREACNVGADEINIIEEKRPDIISSCYRATALLIKNNIDLSDSITAKADIKEDKTTTNNMDSASVKKRVQEDHARNAVILICSVIIGFVIGFVLTMHV